MEYVYYNNEKFYVKDGVLSILRKGIKSIDEIEDLKELTDLESLILCWNEITEIKGLESLKGLEELFLSNNQITSTKGLEPVKGIRVYLFFNPIPKEELEQLRINGYELDPL